MDKKKILFIGIGQGGNKAVDEVLNLDKRYNGLFINTSAKDIALTDNADLDTNVYLIPNADGTGKNRTTAKKYGVNHYVSMVDIVKQYHLQTVVYIAFTSGGGTGSGIAPLYAKMLRQYFPNLVINLVVFKAGKDESKQVLVNTKECLEEVVKIKNFVNNIYIIDNSKRDTLDEINKEWAKSIDNFLSLSSGIGTNIIDSSDLFNLIQDKGVSTILELEPTFTESVDLGLTQTIQDSIYVAPTSFDCHYICMSTENEKFDQDRLLSNFFYEIDKFSGGNDYANIIALSGGEFPAYLIDELSEELDARDKKILERRNLRERRENELLNAIATTPKNSNMPKPNGTKEKIKTSVRSSKEIEDIFSDGFFNDFF